ncbi:MAG TPA: glycosyltransferase family 39 protein [bacterium]|jgi:hypothetical protein
MGGEKTKKIRPRSYLAAARIILLLIVLGGLAVRIWGIDFGLPQRFHPDEPVVVTRAIYGVASDEPDKWNPKAFHWPSMQIYLLGLEYEILFRIEKFKGTVDNRDPDFASFSLYYPGIFYYMGRVTTAIFGIGCIYLIYLIALPLIGMRGAIIASALGAIHPILIRHSRFITPDIPSEFFFLGSLFCMNEALRHTGEIDPDRDAKFHFKYLVAASIFIGLGTGTKYPVGFLFPALALLILFVRRTEPIVTKIMRIVILGVVALAAFLITTPYASLDFPTFINDIRTIGWHVKTGHIGMEAKGGIWIASIAQLLKDSGWVFTVGGFFGFLGFIFEKWKTRWVTLAAFLVVMGGLAPLDVFSDRYLVPVIPFMCIGAAWLIRKLNNVFRLDDFSMKAGAMSMVLLILFAWTGIAASIADGIRLNMLDTRTAALEWVLDNIPNNSKVLVEQGGPNLNDSNLAPLVPEPYYQITDITPLFFLGGPDKEPIVEMAEARPEWIITSSTVKDRYMRPAAREQYPELVYSFEQYYALIEGYMDEMAGFSSGEGMTGPQLVIYKVPEGLWDRVRIESVDAEEALGN